MTSSPIFPLDKYDQTLSNWVKPSDPDYDKPVIQSDEQKQRLLAFYNRYFGKYSPWNADHINKILSKSKPDDLKSIEKDVIYSFNNKNKSPKEIGYNENFRPHPETWIAEISDNINISQFDNLKFNPKNRAIAVDNLNARILPTDDVFFYHYSIPGQGYPFDNLQMSSLWAGTPIYILGETSDHVWSLVLTPDYIAWVKSVGVARTDQAFIKKWTNAALNHFVAITHSKTMITNSHGITRFYAYVGSLFPGEKDHDDFKLMVPAADFNRHAVIDYAQVSKNDAAYLPMDPTPRNFSHIINTLLGRPYGWGNLYFYNDCSAELKNLYVPFGIWLPRHSSDQVYSGKLTDLSEESTHERITYLMEKGKPFSTLVYIDGHIFLHIGNFPNPNSKQHELIPMTFQNMWGLKPKPATHRAVIGKSVLFPLLEHYPEDKSLVSQAGKKHFQVSQLDETPNYLLKLHNLDLKELMYP